MRGGAKIMYSMAVFLVIVSVLYFLGTMYINDLSLIHI